MGTKRNLKMGILVLGILLLAAEQTTAQTNTPELWGKPPYGAGEKNMLTSFEEAKAACAYYKMVVATEKQIQDANIAHVDAYPKADCGYMANGKVGKPLANKKWERCTDKPEAPKKGYDVWCIEGPEFNCPKDWTYVPGTYSCFKYTAKDKGGTFEEATKKCAESGGYLATIDSVAENDALEKMAATPSFIGLKGKPADGPTWQDGSQRKVGELPKGVEYKDKTSTELCFGLDKASTKKWLSLKCSDKNGYICEKDVGYAPTYKVTYRTIYSTDDLSPVDMKTMFPVLEKAVIKDAKRVVDADTMLKCPDIDGVTVTGPILTFTPKLATGLTDDGSRVPLLMFLDQTYAIKSDDYVKTLQCAKLLGTKVAALKLKTKFDPGFGVKAIQNQGKTVLLGTAYSCRDVNDAFNGLRSCIPLIKACGPFGPAIDNSQLYPKQAMKPKAEAPVPNTDKMIIMTPEKCEAICKSGRYGVCRSYSYKPAASAKPTEAICQIAIDTSDDYEPNPAPVDVPKAKAYVRKCANYQEFPIPYKVQVKQTFKASKKPTCTKKTDYTRAAYKTARLYGADVVASLRRLLDTECGRSPGMGGFSFSDSGVTYLPKNGGEEVEVTLNYVVFPASVVPGQMAVKECTNKLKATILKSSTKYKIDAKCGGGEYSPVKEEPAVVRSTGGTSECKYAKTFVPTSTSMFMLSDAASPKSLKWCIRLAPADFTISRNKNCKTASSIPVIHGGKKVSLRACWDRCNTRSDCAAFVWSGFKNKACTIYKKACGTENLEQKLNSFYYLKQALTCEKSESYKVIRTFIITVFKMYIGQGATSTERDELCKADAYTKITATFTAMSNGKECGVKSIRFLAVALEAANYFRVATCTIKIGWPVAQEKETCKVKEAKTNLIQFMTKVVDDGIKGRYISLAASYSSEKIKVSKLVETCTKVAQFSGLEGEGFIFSILSRVYPSIEPYTGKEEECMEDRFGNIAIDFLTFYSKGAAGATVDSADLCTKFENLERSLSLVKSCRPSVVSFNKAMVETLKQLMVGLCEKATAECLKSTYVQCFVKRSSDLIYAFAEGKGTKSKICIDKTTGKENFNEEFSACSKNSKGCAAKSVSTISLLFQPFIAEFLSICDKAQNEKLNWYFALSPQVDLVGSKECMEKRKKAIGDLLSLNKNMFVSLVASGADSTQICSVFEISLKAIKETESSCSAPIRLNLYQALIAKRTEVFAAKIKCGFIDSEQCKKDYGVIDKEFKDAIVKVKAGSFSCDVDLGTLRRKVTTFEKKTCSALTTRYVTAGFATIEYFLRDKCSACAGSLLFTDSYIGGFLNAVFKFWEYKTSPVCTKGTEVGPDSFFDDITKNCKSGSARIIDIAKSSMEYRKKFCEDRDMKWLVPKQETCDVKKIEACFQSYTKVYLKKLAGDDQSVREVCTLFAKMSACVVAEIKTCKEDYTYARFLSVLVTLRHMIVETCDLKPKEKECMLAESYQCLSLFQTEFNKYRKLVTDNQKPKISSICGIAKVADQCITKKTVKCQGDVGFILFLKKTFLIRYKTIEKECKAVKPQKCDASEAFKCVLTYTEDVTKTFYMVDRRNAKLCTEKTTAMKAEQCAAATSIDCADRSMTIIQTCKDFRKTTEKMCQDLVCKPDDVKANLVLMLDASGSVGKKNFANVKEVLKTLVGKLEIGDNNFLVSGMTFAFATSIGFRFSRYKTKDDVLKAIGGLLYTEGGTNTDIALETIKREVEKVQKERPNVPSIVIFITDGKSEDRKKTLAAAANLKKLSLLTVYAVGVGKKLREEELKAIATDDKKFFTVDDFDKLEGIMTKLSQSITCTGTTNKPPVVVEPAGCKVSEVENCLLTFTKDLITGFVKDGADAIKVACLKYSVALTCLKTKLKECSDETVYRFARSFVALLTSVTACKPFLPQPTAMCLVAEAKKCFQELKKTISSVSGDDYSKVCATITEKQNCVYNSIVGCTDFTTYLWVAHINLFTSKVKKSKKCEGKLKPPAVTGKLCGDSKATKCMYEMEQYAVQAAFTKSYGALCRKLEGWKKCIDIDISPCTKEQNAGRRLRFKVKSEQVSPNCASKAESPDCKFMEIRTKIETFTKTMLSHYMLLKKMDKNVCDECQILLKFAMVNRKACSMAMKNTVDRMAKLMKDQLSSECPKLMYGPSAPSTCKFEDVMASIKKFKAKVDRGMKKENYGFCEGQASVKLSIDAGLKGCKAADTKSARDEWNTVVTTIGAACKKRFDVTLSQMTIDVYEGQTVTVDYTFVGCKETLCEGETDCQVRILNTLTNLRGDARCGSKDPFVIQGTFGGSSCGFALTDGNCGNTFQLIIRGRVFYIKQKMQTRQVVFYAEITIGSSVTYKALESKLTVNFYHTTSLVPACVIYGDPHKTDGYSKGVVHDYSEGYVNLLKYKSGDSAYDIQGAFQKCTPKMSVSCLCAVYVRCGGGLVKFDACRRKVGREKKKSKCRKRCGKKSTKRLAIDVEIFYNGNIDTCGLVKRSNREYIVYQPNGRMVTVKLNYAKTFGHMTVKIFHLHDDLKNTDGICYAKQADVRKYHVEWGAAVFESQRWAAFTKPATGPSCVCTATVTNGKAKISQSCGLIKQYKQCNYVFKRDKDLTTILWRTARRINVLATSRKKRAVATNPLAMTPNEVPVVNTWDKNKNFDSPAKAEKACKDAFDGYKNLKSCIAERKMDVTTYLQQCKDDIQVSDSDGFIDTSCSTAYLACLRLQTADTAFMNSPAGQALQNTLQSANCPSDCNTKTGNGKCVAGICDCNDPWAGETCDVNKNDPPTITAVGTNGGICNPALTNCSILVVQGTNILNSAKLTCHFTEKKYGLKGMTDVGKPGTVRGVYVSDSVECTLPKTASYEISISNDGTKTSGDFAYLVYDPKCETCSIDAGTCIPVKTPTCYVNSICYFEGEKLKGDECAICDPKMSTTKLVPNPKVFKCRKVSKKEGLDLTDKLIIGVTCAGIVLGIIGFLIYKYAINPKLEAKKKKKALKKANAESGSSAQPQQPQDVRYASQYAEGETNAAGP